MHELSLADALIRQIEDIATKENAQTIVKITLTMGALCGVDRDAFEFAFPIAAENSIAADATLCIEEVPAEITCDDCGLQSRPNLPMVVCAHCGSHHVTIVAGRDFMIRQLEIAS